MRVGSIFLILLALGAAPAAAADLADRRDVRRPAARVHDPRPATRIHGPLVDLPGVAEQVVVDRGPRLLLETDGALFQPVFAARRLPSRVRKVLVEDDRAWYEP